METSLAKKPPCFGTFLEQSNCADCAFRAQCAKSQHTGKNKQYQTLLLSALAEGKVFSLQSLNKRLKALGLDDYERRVVCSRIIISPATSVSKNGIISYATPSTDKQIEIKH